MTIVKYESKTIDKSYVVLYADEAPADLHIDGTDIGLYGEIWPGSLLLTPEKRYIYGEDGTFREITWGGGSPTPPTPPTTEYTITNGIEHATISPATYTGGQVSITVTPDEGYFINHASGFRVNKDGSDYYPQQLTHDYHQAVLTYDNIDGDLTVCGEVESESGYTHVYLQCTGNVHTEQSGEVYVQDDCGIWYGRIFPDEGLWIDGVTGTQLINPDTEISLTNYKREAYVDLENWDDASVTDKTIVLNFSTIPAGNEYTVTADQHDDVQTMFDSPIAEGIDCNGTIQSQNYYFPMGSISINDQNATLRYHSNEFSSWVDVNVPQITHDITIEYTPVANGDSQDHSYGISSENLTNASYVAPEVNPQGSYVTIRVVANEGHQFADTNELTLTMGGQDIHNQITDYIYDETDTYVVEVDLGLRILAPIEIAGTAVPIV